MTCNPNKPQDPPKGLYSKQFEHDACGMGAVVSIDGTRSYDILDLGNQILMNLQHRGASGSDGITGDGAGILLQIPHRFFEAETAANGVKLPDPGKYGVAMLFSPKDKALSKRCGELFDQAVAHHGLAVLGQRDVPGDASGLGDLARAAEPYIRQVFLGAGSLDNQAFERTLYLARKRAEQLISQTLGDEADDFYICSMSSRTICYKGMFLAPQLFGYYPDLSNRDMESSLALVHQRYSTNTFPNWKLAQPFRMIAHNGEINTLSGNANKMRAREGLLACDLLGENLDDLTPILTPGASDSAQFDNAVELLVRAGRSLPHAMMMMVPEAFGANYHISTDKRAFYEYHSAIMEPWDGPAAMAFTDGRIVGGMLDRNGLRPGRYVVTTDGLVVLASEAGVVDLPAKRIRAKGRLRPGRMFLVDTEAGRIILDNEIKGRIARQKPYRRWLAENRIELRGLFSTTKVQAPDPGVLYRRMQVFGYTREVQRVILIPMAVDAQEAVGSMGTDTPLAVLSDRPKLLFEYFKQLFAQVTNPPIDPLREGLVMSLMSFVGRQRNLLSESPEHCHMLKLPHPVLTNEDITLLKAAKRDDLTVASVDALFDADSDSPGKALQQGIAQLVEECVQAVEDGASLVVISDRNFTSKLTPIPILLATSAVHHALLDRKLRGRAGLIIETGEAREVMHFCLLCGYGANAVNPYLAFDALNELSRQGEIPEHIDAEQIVDNYIAAVKKGILKTMSKMGISTLRSYQGAQLFEAIGINRSVIDAYFSGTPSRIEGVDIDTIAREAISRRDKAYADPIPAELPLEFGGEYSFRVDGEGHLWNPESVSLLQHAVRTGDSETYRKYAELINNQSEKLFTLRGLFEFSPGDPVEMDEVESAEEIVKRFCTGAMSHGSISKETHETMARAMNRLGAMSNTGEGGEDPARYKTGDGGDSLNSAIKQVASARFGVTIEYLSQAKMLQIKMAQGAKPGEGGQLPGYKVTEDIARLRHATPGVTLISPPPHHDIYSIEDLAQLIYDLKCANPEAQISVKLVSEVGVGTIAAGVAKGAADEILISGHDGGTGASPLSSIKHTGGPWELGLAETQQTLMRNGLRDRVCLQADGQMKTGRDVVIAALLGAERFGFGTAPLVALGCCLMRKCHLGTCPVGIAAQDPELRKQFTGQPEHLQRFMMFIANEVRTIMAALGFRKFEDMIGQTCRLQARKAIEHWKARGLDLSAILYSEDTAGGQAIRQVRSQDEMLTSHLDWKILETVEESIRNREKVSMEAPIHNVDRTVGAILSNRIAQACGADGLDDGTIDITLNGSAGQSFGAFLAPGVTLRLVGDSNDYLGKGLSGGRIVVQAPPAAPFPPHENVIVGNVVLYGATSGEVFINGLAGERFAVRNSGAEAVVEGVGDHGCEYMTGGTVVVLGRTGRNFAAGMSGGTAYVLDEHQLFDTLCNLDLVDIEPVLEPSDIDKLHALITQHHEWTHSLRAKHILDRWRDMLGRFVKVVPIDYRRAIQRMRDREDRQGDSTPATEEVFHG
ncbi:MAG: glutamate synthase large subunit [Phycisphaerae bacterium]|jgi:glutamate synthase domain-containing protein 2/glutamate synthase domain-containing protein 1/glutamate synthase domain-containing protein 3|nr:glutamate synthase large subunit [Phycisphaerae bacterium]